MKRAVSKEQTRGLSYSYSKGLLDLLRLAETTLLLSSCFMNTQRAESLFGLQLTDINAHRFLDPFKDNELLVLLLENYKES